MGSPSAAVTAPEWLTQRGGVFRTGLECSWYVVFNNEPQYALRLAPAGGQHTCLVTQAQSGKRLDQGTVYPTAEAALRGGLDQLRQALGW